MHRLDGALGERDVPRFVRVDRLRGLHDGNVNALAEDAEGRVWASTDSGLAVIDPATLRARALRRAEGVVYATHWTNSVARTAAGELLRGAADAPLAVPADANGVVVEHAALDCSAPERVRHAHRLDGFGADWVANDATPHRLHQPAAGRVPAAAARQQPRRRRGRGRAPADAAGAGSAVLERASISDPLTGLHNRRLLTEQIDAPLAAGPRRASGPAGRRAASGSRGCGWPGPAAARCGRPGSWPPGGAPRLPAATRRRR